MNSTGGTWPTFDPDWSDNDFDLETSLAAGALQDAFDYSGTVLGPFMRATVTRDALNPRPTTLIQVTMESNRRLIIEVSDFTE